MLFSRKSVRYGLAGVFIGASAPIIYIALHHRLFHGDLSFSEFLRENVFDSAESILTHSYIAGAMVVMGAAGFLIGKNREEDLALTAEIEAKNAELRKSQAELKYLTENLEKKVAEGHEELVQSSGKLKEANAKLLKQIGIQRKIAGNVPSLLALLDTSMNYVEINEYGSRHFIGKPLIDILGHKCYEVAGNPDSVCIEECASRKAILTGREATHSRHLTLNGRDIITENKSIPIKGPDGKVTNVLMIVSDTTAKKKEEEDLKRRANHDALTGAYNKHYLDLYLENEENKNKTNKRKRGPYTVIYADLDNLKAANDTYGHGAGDILLKKISRIFQDNTRHEDIVARVGGDEFVLILPHSGPEEGEALIGRFRRQCDEWNSKKDLADEHSGLTLGVSYGLSTSVYGIDLLDTIKRADSSMYRSKKDKKSSTGIKPD